MKIEVGKSYAYRVSPHASGDTRFVITDKIGDIYIGYCGKQENRFVFDKNGRNLSSNFDSKPQSGWDLVPNKHEVHYRIVYDDGRAQSLWYCPTTKPNFSNAVAGFLKIDGVVHYYNTAEKFQQAYLDNTKHTDNCGCDL